MSKRTSGPWTNRLGPVREYGTPRSRASTQTRHAQPGRGVAVGYWFSPHFYVTLTGLNPILSVSSESEDNGPGMTSESSNTGFGLVWDPEVAAMAHLYF